MNAADQNHSNREPELAASSMPVAERNSEPKSTTTMKERRFKLGRQVAFLSHHLPTAQLTPVVCRACDRCRHDTSVDISDKRSDDPDWALLSDVEGFVATTVTLVKLASRPAQHAPSRRTERRARNQSVSYLLSPSTALLTMSQENGRH